MIEHNDESLISSSESINCLTKAMRFVMSCDQPMFSLIDIRILENTKEKIDDYTKRKIF